jgi:NAD-dependent deacetylase
MSNAPAAVPAAALDDVAARLRASRRTTVLTGAGISAASGVPTFRGAGGLWGTYRAEDLATPEAFARDPRLVWSWYDARRQNLLDCRPNAGHAVLASWASRLPGFTLLTQNVDGLHERAGTTGAVRLHGSIWHVRCVRGCSPPREERRAPLPEIPPRCACGALLRPDVVWFGEMLDPGVLRRADAATACDVFVTAGTSSIVHPAAGLVAEARARGAFTIEINPEETGASAYVDRCLRGPAETVLPELDSRLIMAR